MFPVAVPVPDSGKQGVDLLSPSVGNPISGLIFSSQVMGYQTHYLHGRTQPHIDAPAVCIGCSEHASKRWKGYLFVLSDQTGKHALFELPAQTVRLSLQLRDNAHCLRGMRIRLWRFGPHANSPVGCNLTEGRATEKLPDSDEPNVGRWLSVIWGIEDVAERIYSTEGGRDA